MFRHIKIDTFTDAYNKYRILKMKNTADCSIIEYCMAFTILGLNVSGVIFLTSPGHGILGSTLVALSSILSLSYGSYKRKNYSLAALDEDEEKGD